MNHCLTSCKCIPEASLTSRLNQKLQDIMFVNHLKYRITTVEETGNGLNQVKMFCGQGQSIGHRGLLYGIHWETIHIPKLPQGTSHIA